MGRAPAKSTMPRRSTRRKTETVTCGIGEVIDLSPDGMRVQCDGKPPVAVGQIISIRLDTGTHCLALNGQVRWIRRTGLRSRQMGILFLNLKPKAAAALESIGMFGFIDLDAVAKAKARRDRSDRTDGPVKVSVQLPDYYAILGVASDASDEEIQLAYRALARRFHPDVTTEENGERRFIEMTQAYDVLRNPSSRKDYDRRRVA